MRGKNEDRLELFQTVGHDSLMSTLKRFCVFGELQLDLSVQEERKKSATQRSPSGPTPRLSRLKDARVEET